MDFKLETSDCYLSNDLSIKTKKTHIYIYIYIFIYLSIYVPYVPLMP